MCVIHPSLKHYFEKVPFSDMTRVLIPIKSFQLLKIFILSFAFINLTTLRPLHFLNNRLWLTSAWQQGFHVFNFISKDTKLPLKSLQFTDCLLHLFSQFRNFLRGFKSSRTFRAPGGPGGHFITG